MIFTFIDILKIITVSQIFLISGFLVFNSKSNRKRNLFLLVFIMSKALFLLDSLLISHHDDVLKFSPDIMMIGNSFQWLIGPALYFSIVVTTNKNFKLKTVHLLNLVPFLIHFGFICVLYHFQSIETKFALMQNWFPYTTSWFRYSVCLNYTQFAIYGVLALIVLSKTKSSLLNTNSQPLDRNIFYFKFLVYDFIIAWGINTIAGFITLSSTASIILWTATILNIFFIANAMVYQGLKFPEIFLFDFSVKQKYEKNPLSDNEKEKYASKLQKHMNNQKPYLNPTFSLSELAQDIAVPNYVVSQILNQTLNQNFYDYVNNYRIEESKKMLSDFSEASTILEIAFKSGFNSKSAFNSAFKKYTGMTPKEFKKAAA